MEQFNKTFELHKKDFKEKFGINWNENSQLYLSYLGTIYLDSTYAIQREALNKILGYQNETNELLREIKKQLNSSKIKNE